MITRRDALLSASALALGPTLAAQAQQGATELSSANVEYPLIDAHCHVFNASDIPAERFLLRCYFHIYGSDQVAPGCIPEAPPSWVEQQFFIRPLVTILLNIFPSAALAPDETKILLKANEIGQLRLSPEGLGEKVARGANALQRLFVETKTAARSIDADFQTDEQREEFARFVLAQAKMAALPGRAAAFLETPEGSTRAFDALVGWRDDRSGGLYDEPTSDLGRYWAWGTRLSGRRTEIAEQLSALYGGTANKVRLHTPALVDYSYWLDEKTKSSLSEQADLMEQLTIYLARTKGVLFHGYMAFDPLRETLEGGALERVKRAVTHQGFIGAKIYPPMGFKAAGNAGDPSITLPSHVVGSKSNGQERETAAERIKTALDTNLDAFYAWCAPKRVPILSHAHDSYGAGPCFGRRADPANWRPVLEKYKDLRVCLAHLGGFQRALKNAALPPSIDWTKLNQTWEWRFGELVEGGMTRGFGQNLYADMSYFSDVLHDEGVGDVKEAWGRWIKRFKFLPGRLVYGSDWILLDQEKNKGQHLARTWTFLDEVFANADYGASQRREMLRDIFSRNAIRFLGIDPSKIDPMKPEDPNAASRLLEFYKKNSLKPQCLREGRTADCGTTFLDQFRI